MEKASTVILKTVLVLAFVFGSGCNKESEDLSGPTKSIRLSYTYDLDDEDVIPHKESAVIPFGTSGRVYYIGPDNTLDAVNCEIVNLGKVYEKQIEIPQTDWTTTVDAEVGSNYIIRMKDGTYGRLSISDITSRWNSSQPSLTTYYADVKFQDPYIPK